jgi:hypothetical protein
VLADDHLNGFFVGMDMARQRQHIRGATCALPTHAW